MNIWSACVGQVLPEDIGGQLIRIVESQEQVATNNLVDDLNEQEILERLLDETKPHLPSGTEKLHYLLATPFRYPPLKYGSRFGSRYEASLFYGSCSLVTAFAEVAYYRLLFWQGMEMPPPTEKFITQHTVFEAAYATANGFKLQELPFSDYESYLTNPIDYTATQQLGAAMRELGIEAFEYVSARDPQDRGLNVALFTPDALASLQPSNQQQWLCDTSANKVDFYAFREDRIYSYAIESFLVKNIFPEPAL